MPRRLLLFALVALAACKGEEKSDSIYLLNREPVSVRGWIRDVAGAKQGETIEMELARRQGLFAATSLWVESSPYASGGIAGNGAFVILDVPPQSATIGFNAPGAETAKLVMQGIPGNAEVFIPDIILERGGSKVLDPKKIQVKLPAKIDKARATGQYANVGGYKVPIVLTPLNQFTERREYPEPPGFRPVATVK